MTINSAEPGEKQSPKNTISEQIAHSRTQYVVSRYNEKLRDLDRRFVLCAFESGLISGEHAESWLTQIEAGHRPKGAIKSLIIDHYAHGKLSADKVAELFKRLDLGRG